MNTRTWLLVGITLHGIAFALYFVTAQLYVDPNDLRLRTRAQALLTLMIGGFGNLAGFLGTGWWRHYCTPSGETNWPAFLARSLGHHRLRLRLFSATRYRGQHRIGAEAKLG